MTQSGAQAMQPLPDDGDLINSGIPSSAELQYEVDFTQTGTYYVWLRGWAKNNGNTAHVGIDGQDVVSGRKANVTPSPSTAWDWSERRVNGNRLTISVSSAGVHTVNLWMREDGLFVDRLVLTTDVNYDPDGIEPPESPRGWQQ